MVMQLEACVGNYEEAVRAYNKGATRIELCDNLLEGGTTPSYGTIKKTINDINVPINVIIRPRGGNFIYSKEEIEIMIEDIKLCNELKVNGIVIGVLDKENKIDELVIKELLKYRENLEVTFHMAFDEIEDKKEAIDKLIELGINRILTKGGEVSALNNLNTIKGLIEYANKKIIIMPGGGVNASNKDEVISTTGAQEVHGTKIV
ncbi:MAG: copper homeostasis protein CutC [Clostridium sp.]